MAIKLNTNYAKKLGLPGYSSHSFSASIETELADLADLADEVARLYHMLQVSVDEQIQQAGFVPTENGARPTPTPTTATSKTTSDGWWKCSDKQRNLILKIVDEQGLDRNVINQLAIQRFGTGVRQLNKLQASGLINELLESSSNGEGSRSGSPKPKGARA